MQTVDEDSTISLENQRKALFNLIRTGQCKQAIDFLCANPLLSVLTDDRGNNVLLYAISYSTKEFVRCLLDELNIPMTAVNKEGNNVILQAVYAGKLELVDYFLSREGNLFYSVDRHGQDPFLKACHYNYPTLADRGSQYCSNKYRKIIEDYQLIGSMSRKGNCWDNAIVESFFHTLKVELIHENIYKTRGDIARQSVFQYIEGYYNQKRLHSAIDYKTPIEVECAC